MTAMLLVHWGREQFCAHPVRCGGAWALLIAAVVTLIAWRCGLSTVGTVIIGWLFR
jgi:hypothetical protein